MSLINEDLLSEMSLTWDNSDPWGSALGWHFAIAETLTVAGYSTPGAWKFRMSPLDKSELAERAENSNSDFSYEDETVARLVVDDQIDTEDLEYAGNVLMRYCGILRTLGLDY